MVKQSLNNMSQGMMSKVDFKDKKVQAAAAGLLLLVLLVVLYFAFFRKRSTLFTLPDNELEIIVVYGQSNAMGSAANPPDTTGTKYPENLLCANRGPRTLPDPKGGVPFVGTFETQSNKYGETSGSATITKYYEMVDKPKHLHVATVVYGMGGQRIDQLMPNTNIYKDMQKRVRAAAGARSQINAKKVSVQAFCYVQGESDMNTPGSKYKSNLESMISNVNSWAQNIGAATNGMLSQSAPFIVLCQIAFGSTTDSQIQQTQLDMEKEGKLVIATPMYPLIFEEANIHLSALGQRQMGAYFGRAIAYLKDGKKPPALRITSATVQGSDIMVKLSVPSPPLVLEERTKPINYGFSIDGVSIESVQVQSSDTIIIKTSGGVSKGGKLKYAYSSETASEILTPTDPDNRATGGVRDSCDDRMPDGLIGGDRAKYDAVRLRNWLPHCIVVLE